jgi:hypothetical protein
MNTGNEFPKHSQDIQPNKGCLAFFSALFSRKTQSNSSDSSADETSDDESTYIRITDVVRESTALSPTDRDRWNDVEVKRSF